MTNVTALNTTNNTVPKTDLRGNRYTPEQLNSFYKLWQEAKSNGVSELDFIKQTSDLHSRDALKKAVLMNEGFLIKSRPIARRREEAQTVFEFMQDCEMKDGITLGRFSEEMTDDLKFALKSSLIKKLAFELIMKMSLELVLMELEIDAEELTMKELNQKFFGSEAA